MDTETIFLIWFFLFGLVVGSFLNAVIYRIPRGYKLTLPSRSICTSCKKTLTWIDNIPLLSYFFLRGRCRFCKKTFSFRYPTVEFITGVLYLALYRNFGFSLLTLYYAVFASALVAITFIDLDFRIVPDVISIPGAVLGIVGSFFVADGSQSLFGMALGGGLFWFMSWGYFKLTGRDGLGFGDVKLLAMIGAFLGAKNVLITIFVSSLLGSLVGILLIVVQRKSLKTALPFGPFLAIGALFSLFWGDALVWLA